MTDEKVKQDRSFLYFSLPIIVLMLITSSIGIFNSGIYSRETTDWQAQTIGQDYSNLLITVPALLIAALFAANGNRIGKIAWAGVMITNVYAFMIYSFAVPFNFLFHLYCAILGLSVFSVLHFFINHLTINFTSWFTGKVPVKTIGIFLVVVAALFILLWLSQSLPGALANRVPESVSKDGLLTNPVHVLDFSFYLPLMFISGISLMRRKAIGFFLAPVMIVFGIMTNINILSLMIVSMVMIGTNTWPMMIIFSIFTAVCLGFLWVMLRNISVSS